MESFGFQRRDLVVSAVSVFVAGVAASFMARRIAGNGTKPFSKCEKKCLDDFPDDTEKRLNCMLKCVADDEAVFQRVIAVQ